jgi:hypothetical protein
MDHKNFKKVVEECWRAQEGSGWMAFILKEKLKALKFRLKEWHKEEYGKVENRIAKIVEDIEELDIRGESTGLSSQEVLLRKDLFVDFWKLQKIREASIFQRLKSKWLRQGDENSKYFHSCVVSRSKRNSIMALKVGDIWLEKPDQIKEAVVNFFENHFAANNTCRPNLDGVMSPEENLALTAPFSLDEIHLAVMDSDGNKSPGPDGFNFGFLKKCRDLLKGEIRIMFDQFHGIGSLPKSLLSYFVTLIPKVNSPLWLGGL